MRISDWSSDVCSSDLAVDQSARPGRGDEARKQLGDQQRRHAIGGGVLGGAEHQRQQRDFVADRRDGQRGQDQPTPALPEGDRHLSGRSEEHTSELQSLMRISYAVFCLKKKKKHKNICNKTTCT